MKLIMEQLRMNMILLSYIRGLKQSLSDDNENKIFGQLDEVKPKWNTLKDVYLYLTGVETDYLTNTSKMTYASFGFSAKYCKAGSHLQKIKNSVCSMCYGLKGMYVFPKYMAKSERTIKSLDKKYWKEAMVFIINKKEIVDFRWFDNGDLQSDKMLRDIMWIAKQTPHVKHWLPTKEPRMVKRVIYNGSKKPSNLDIRLSVKDIDGDPRKMIKLARQLGVNVSVAVSKLTFKHLKPNNEFNFVKCHTAHSIRDDIKYSDAQKKELGECGECRACWNDKVEVIYYEVH